MRGSALIVATLLMTSVLVPAAAGGAAAQEGEAYAGAHVSFDVESNAVVDYAVDGDVLFDEVTVQSEGAGDADVGVGADARAASELQGADLRVASEARASVTIETEGDAEMTAHDTERGHLVVEAGDESAVVGVETGGEADAESDGDRVVVDTGETTGTFLVVGEGEVAVDDDGDVVAELDEDARLVFRSNGEERDDDDRAQEDLIEDGDSVAELHVFERDGEQVANAVEYSGDVAVEVTQRTEGHLEVTVERATDDGTVLIASVSETVVESAEDVEVRVDGEAAAEAESYGELRSTAAGDDGHAFMVTNAAATGASADVLVAIDGFSERTVGISESGADDGDGDADETGTDGGDDAETGDADADDDTDGEVPGFGATAALVALLASALAALRRR